ncbi:MAG: hypothetical protein NTU53_11100 [Planctomycetota bacterium]|nr:hypothetical protein [Planctomycetota bacterium]
MAETTGTLNSATNTQPDMGAPPLQVEPAAPEVQQPEPPPEWAAKLQADVTALQEQVVRWQSHPPTWFRQATAKLAKEAAKQIDLAAQLRQLEQRVQKARDAQTHALVASSNRAVTAAGKGLAVQFGKQLKDMDRRIRGVEKILGQIQRKMK